MDRHRLAAFRLADGAGGGVDRGNRLITRAYQTGEATYLAPFEYTLLIFASFWAFALYGQWVSWQAILGMALIVGSGVLIALRSGGETGLVSEER